jgi:hypothetical protein
MICAADTGMGICETSAGALKIGRKANGGGDPWYLCVTLAALVGIPCESDDDCHFETVELVSKETHPWRCRDVTTSDGQVSIRQCVAGCQLDSSCSSCDGGDKHGCIPDDIIPCPYYGVASKVSGPCKRTNGFGECSGGSVCAELGEAPVCDAPEPASETCGPAGTGDGIDQDCDGETDEGCEP